MIEETALPTGDTAAASEQAKPDAAATEVQGEQQVGQENPEGEEGEEGEQKEPAKKEKTPEQREIDRLRRRVDNLTRRRYELEAAMPARGAQSERSQQNDDEPVTLSRAELQKLVAERAEQLAPSIKEQEAERERREGVMKSLAKQWGQDKFNAIAEELDDAMGGLADASGRPKPATEALLEAEDPKSVIEYLTDPANTDDAERFSRLTAVRAGREIARIEAKLADEKAKAKAQPSKAARPLEAVKGGGVPTGMPDPSNTKAYIAWANAQERASR